MPDEFDELAEVFVGGTVTGTVCIPLARDDLDTEDAIVAMNFEGDDYLFVGDWALPAATAIDDPA